jgi:hypothetical protein
VLVLLLLLVLVLVLLLVLRLSLMTQPAVAARLILPPSVVSHFSLHLSCVLMGCGTAHNTLLLPQ